MSLLQRLKLRHKFAGLSLIGMLMVAVPLVPLLRHQGLEIHSALSEQAGLDPVMRALSVQRSLLAHRDVAHQVLSGNEMYESERRARSAEVDARVNLLGKTLAVSQVERAIDESQALRQDWGQLSAQIEARRVGVAESAQAHRLLVEQVLQVIDLVADLSGSRANPGELSVVAATSLRHALPRLASQTAALSDQTRRSDPALAERDLVAAENGLAQTLGRLNQAVARDTDAAAELAAAAALAGATTDRVLRLAHAREPAADAELQSAVASALHAQQQLATAAHNTVAQSLSTRLEQTERQRAQLVLLLLSMATAAAALAAHLYAALARRERLEPATRDSDQALPGVTPAASEATVPASAHVGGAAARPDAAASQLLQRLRQADASAPAATPDTPPRQPQER